jgi:hypothetical protein
MIGGVLASGVLGSAAVTPGAVIAITRESSGLKRSQATFSLSSIALLGLEGHKAMMLIECPGLVIL